MNRKRNREKKNLDKKKIIVIGILFAIILGVAGYYRLSGWEYFSYNSKFLNCEYDIVQNPENSEEICMITNIEDYPDVAEYQKANRFVEGRYIALSTIRGWKKKDYTYSCLGQRTDCDKFMVEIYDVVDREVVQTIDIKKEMRPYAKEWQFLAEYNAIQDIFIDEGGSPILYISIDKIIHGDYAEEYGKYMDFYYLTYNLETGEAGIISHTEAYRNEEALEDMKAQWNILDYSNSALLQENGFYNSTDFMKKPCFDKDWVAMLGQSGYMILHVSAWALPEDNAELYRHFPGLEKYRDDKDKVVTFFLPDYPQVEDIFPLLVEAEQGVSFENVVLKEESAIDGQEHEIHSFEEYYQWRK